jgi:hypothetical protein
MQKKLTENILFRQLFLLTFFRDGVKESHAAIDFPTETDTERFPVFAAGDTLDAQTVRLL